MKKGNDSIAIIYLPDKKLLNYHTFSITIKTYTKSFYTEKVSFRYLFALLRISRKNRQEQSIENLSFRRRIGLCSKIFFATFKRQNKLVGANVSNFKTGFFICPKNRRTLQRLIAECCNTWNPNSSLFNTNKPLNEFYLQITHSHDTCLSLER